MAKAFVEPFDVGAGLHAFVTAAALAEDLSDATDRLPPGTFTSSQHSDEWKIKNALSAGPPWITDNATVVEMSTVLSGGNPKVTERIIRPGTNGWTCVPDEPGRPQHDPMCGDETTMKWRTAVMEGSRPSIASVFRICCWEKHVRDKMFLRRKTHRR